MAKYVPKRTNKPRALKPPYIYAGCACKARMRDGKYIACPDHKSAPNPRWIVP